MNSNGIAQMQMNGHGLSCAHPRHGGRKVSDGSDAGRKIRQSISYMLEHLNQPLHVATLAAAVNVSPSHYSALFKYWTGCPPIDFFIHLRMERACRLFDSTTLNVKEVAAQLGYDDPFYFSRTFKAVKRIAPSEYRMMPEEKRNTIRGAARPFGTFIREGNHRIENGGDLWTRDREGVEGERENSSDACIVRNFERENEKSINSRWKDHEKHRILQSK